MKVLLINGSAHEAGCTYTALCEVASALNAVGQHTAESAGRVEQAAGVYLDFYRGV